MSIKSKSREKEDYGIDRYPANEYTLYKTIEVVSLKLVTSNQMVELEREAVRLGVQTRQLMENAGLEIALQVKQILSDLRGRKVVVLVGPGNNGGDGLVAARHLANWKSRVDLVIPVKKPVNEDNLIKAVQAGAELTGPGDLEGAVKSAEIIIDSFFGTGGTRAIEEPFKRILEVVKSSKLTNRAKIIVAVDLPSGLNSDTGQADPVTVQADYTLALGYPKVGLYNSNSASSTSGEIRVLDIGIPGQLVDNITTEIIDQSWAASELPVRPVNAHKGSFGKALVIAGCANYPGAAALCCSGAMRTGAGLVALAIPGSLQSLVACRLAEITYIPLTEISKGVVAHSAVDEILGIISSYQCLLIGCGLGLGNQTINLVNSLLLESNMDLPPTVIDADGLNILSKTPNWQSKLGPGSILTPHPGEMSRLTGMSVDEIQSNRIGAARKAAVEWGQIVVLKGACTVIASPDDRLMVNPFASPVLASAGTGDVLAGIIAGLCCQGTKPFEAACLGVWLHSKAGQEVALEIGETGALAGDLLMCIPRVINKLKKNKVK